MLRIAMGSAATALDPTQLQTIGDLTRTDLIFDTLVRLDRSGELVPSLATEWREVNDTTWEFSLREGVTFHDGTDFNAEAVKISLERAVATPQGEGWLGLIEEVEVVDPMTVHVHLSAPFTAILNNLSVPVAGMISPAALEEYGDDVISNPVGTGPFRFVEWVPDTRLELEKNPDYWGDQFNISGVEFLPIPETGTRFSALRSGEVDVIENPPPLEASPDQESDEFVTIVEPKGRPVWLGFNVGSMGPKVLDDVRVRQAIAHAIDKEAIVENVLEGLGRPATNGLIPPEYANTEPPIHVEYDPDESRRLLEEAGVAEGLELRLTLPTERYLKDQEVAEVIQSQLGEVGIDLTLDVKETGAWDQALTDHETELFWHSFGVSTGDGLDMLARAFCSDCLNNAPDYSNPKMDELIAQMTEAQMGSSAREDLMWEAQHLMLEEDIVIVPVYHMVNFWATRPGVSEFHTTPSEMLDLSKVTVEQ